MPVQLLLPSSSAVALPLNLYARHALATAVAYNSLFFVSLIVMSVSLTHSVYMFQLFPSFESKIKWKKKLSSECYFFFNFHRIQMQSYSFSVLNKEKRHLHALFVNIPTKVKIAFFFRELIVIGTCISSLVSSIAFNSNRLVFQYIHIILMFFLSTS